MKDQGFIAFLFRYMLQNHFLTKKSMANALGITYRTLLNSFRHLGREKGGNVAFQHLIPYCLENGFSMDEIYREYRKAADPETR